MLKYNVSDAYSDRCTKIKIYSDDDLPLERTINMDNAVIFIKSVFNKNYNRYYKAFLENVLINNI